MQLPVLNDKIAEGSIILEFENQNKSKKLNKRKARD